MKVLEYIHYSHKNENLFLYSTCNSLKEFVGFLWFLARNNS